MAELEQCIRDLRFAREHMCLNCPYDDILDKAIDLLKMHEPRVLKLEELVALNPLTPVYIEECDDPEEDCHITEYIGQYLIPEDNLAGADPGPYIVFRHYSESKEDYGSYWRCWNVRPTYEQRKAAKWYV